MMTLQQLNNGEIFRSDMITGVYSMETTKGGVCYLISRDFSENGAVLFLVSYRAKDHFIIQFIHETYAPFIRIDFRDCKICAEGDPTKVSEIQGTTGTRIRIYNRAGQSVQRCSNQAARMFKNGWRPS